MYFSGLNFLVCYKIQIYNAFGCCRSNTCPDKRKIYIEHGSLTSPKPQCLDSLLLSSFHCYVKMLGHLQTCTFQNIFTNEKFNDMLLLYLPVNFIIFVTFYFY